jgi:hypothetical protein
MKIIIALLFSSILFTGFSDNQVWVKAKMPLDVYSGDKFTVEITINKLDLQHFAEFRQKLPNGFIAKGKQMGESDFSFKEQTVKFTWLRLPREQQIIISYEVQLNENIKGQFSLPGQFTYIYKNQRGTADLQDYKINVFTKGDSFKK